MVKSTLVHGSAVMCTVMLLTLTAVSSAVAQTAIQFNGQNAADEFGWSAAAVGDVNCDGAPDILIGAPTVDSPDDYAGRCYLYYGPFDGNTIPVGQADAVFTAQAFGDNLGVAVAPAGDHNSDGCGDILMGARGNDQPGTQAGRVYLFNGPISGTRAVTQANATFTGEAFDELGWALRGDFDLNGDTIDDVALGAPFADNVGKAHVFFGPHAATQSTADADLTIIGVIPFEDLGTAVAVGDLNHDGVDDFVVGGPHASIQVTVPGRAYVFFGPVSGIFPASAADVILEGEVEQDHFGVSVDVGDIDADGDDDLIVGADQFYSSGTGKAYVFRGPLKGGFYTAAKASAALLSENFGTITSFNFGVSVAAGDVNGDGFADVIVGDPNAKVATNGNFGAGIAYVFHGPLAGSIMASQADQVFTGLANDMLGHSVASAGDIDGNGVGDMILGAPADSFSTTKAGKARLILSRAVGDLDNDGDVDLADWGLFAPCLGGPRVTTPPAGCSALNFAAADLDGDEDADLADAARFGRAFGN
jgi:hypothetical protein